MGGPAKAAMVPHLLGCRCLFGALAYLASLRLADGGLRSDFYPEVLLDVVDFPQCAPIDDLGLSWIGLFTAIARSTWCAWLRSICGSLVTMRIVW